MDDSIDIYWIMRLQRCRKALDGNGFEAFVARDALHALKTYDFYEAKSLGSFGWQEYCSKGIRHGTGMNCPKAGYH